MKAVPAKDKIFVGGQFLLFILYLIPLSPWPFYIDVYWRYFALLMSIVGLLIILISILQLNTNLSPFPTPVDSSTLIQTGLYKYIRHPIYSGIILAAIGVGVFYMSLWKIAVGSALWVLFSFKSRYEETLLQAKFQEYTKYMQATTRFFPFI